MRGAARDPGLGPFLGVEVTPEAGVPPSLRGPRGHTTQGGERGAASVGLEDTGGGRLSWLWGASGQS